MILTKDIYNVVAEHIFKKEDVRAGVWSVVGDGLTIYAAEQKHGLAANSLGRYVKILKRELIYLDALGVNN